MKTYVNLLYSIVNKIDKWDECNLNEKIVILNFYIEIKDNNEKFIDYFDRYSLYLSKKTLNSFTKSVLEHRF